MRYVLLARNVYGWPAVAAVEWCLVAGVVVRRWSVRPAFWLRPAFLTRPAFWLRPAMKSNRFRRAFPVFVGFRMYLKHTHGRRWLGVTKDNDAKPQVLFTPVAKILTIRVAVLHNNTFRTGFIKIMREQK